MTPAPGLVEIIAEILERAAEARTEQVNDEYEARRLADWADRLSALTPASPWRDIESAPRDGTAIFWLQPVTMWPEWDDGMRSSSDLGPVPQFKPYAWMGRFMCWRTCETATHWMPLPPPPESHKEHKNVL